MVKQGGKKAPKNGRGRNPKEQKLQKTVEKSSTVATETVTSHPIEPVGTAQALKPIHTEDGTILPGTTKVTKAKPQPVGVAQATESIVTEDDTIKAQASA